MAAAPAGGILPESRARLRAPSPPSTANLEPSAASGWSFARSASPPTLASPAAPRRSRRCETLILW